MKEILVHLSAPTSRKDDERYRRLAEAYDDFEPVSTINCTARTHVDSAVNRGTHDHPGPAPTTSDGLSRPPRSSKAVCDGSSHPLGGEADAVASTAGTPVAAGFVKPTQIVPASRQSVAKDKKPVIYAHAPDFGSFASTPASSRSPLEQHEPEGRWTQQPRSSVKRSASGQSKVRTGGNTPLPLFTEDTQDVSAMVEDHVDTTFYGSEPSFSDIESPIARRAGKRPRLSSEFVPAEISQANHAAGSQESATPPILTPWMPPPRTPPTEDMSSQMIDDFGPSNPKSSLRQSDDSAPLVAITDGSHDNLRPAHESVVQQADNVSEAHGSQRAEPILQELRPSQISTQDESDDSIHPGQSDSSNRSQAGASTPPAPPLAALPTIAEPSAPERAAQKLSECDFASLPLQLLPKASTATAATVPPATTKRIFNEVTSMLQLYAEKASIAKHYRPAVVAREIRPTERGCWMFDASGWERERQHEFWTRMQYLVEHGYLGNAWLQRNVAEDWRRGETDGKEAEGLGRVWLFCWGQAAPYLWVVLLTESHLEIRRKASRARWVVGPMESLEVVVKMPEPGK